MSRLIHKLMYTDKDSTLNSSQSFVSFENTITDLDLEIERMDRDIYKKESLEIAKKSLESTSSLLDQLSTESTDSSVREQLNDYCKSMLSYQLEDTPLHLDNLSQEGIRERIDSIRGAIENTLSDFRDKVLSSFQKIEKTRDSLEQRHKELTNRFENANPKNVETDEITVKGCNRVHFESEYDPSTVSSGLEVTSEILNEAIKHFINTAIKIKNNREETMGNVKDLADKVKEAEEVIKENDKKSTRNITDYRKKIKELSQRSLSGGKKVTPGKSGLQLTISSDSKVDNVSSSQKIDANNVNRAGELLQATNQLLKTIDEIVERNEQLNDELSDHVKAFTEFLNDKAIVKMPVVSNFLHGGEASRKVDDFYENVTKQTIQVQQYGLRTVSSAMDYAEAMIEEMEV